MKKALFLLVLLTSFIQLRAQVHLTSNSISGFKIMSLPRTYMPVGAVWNQVTGPVTPGVGQDQLITSSSFSTLNSAVSKEFEAAVEAGILNFLKSEGHFKTLSTTGMSITSLSIVTLNSVNTLKANIGNQILFEALKADKIKIIVKKEDVNYALADISKIFKNSYSIAAVVDKGNEREILAEGLDLFIGYRIVKVKKAKEKKERLKFISQSHGIAGGPITISSRYEANTDHVTVQVCPCNIMGCIQDMKANGDQNDLNSLFDKCGIQKGWDFTVILKNRLNPETGVPEQYHFTSKAGTYMGNRNFALYSIPTSQGLEVSYMNVEKLFYTPLNSSLAYLSTRKSDAKVSIITSRFFFENVSPALTAGW